MLAHVGLALRGSYGNNPYSNARPGTDGNPQFGSSFNYTGRDPSTFGPGPGGSPGWGWLEISGGTPRPNGMAWGEYQTQTWWISQMIGNADANLGIVTAIRGSLGALQNRMEFTMQNLSTSSENLSSANSRIRDADMAKEMMRLTQANVLQQAATAMLSQGNQAPQAILQLLA